MAHIREVVRKGNRTAYEVRWRANGKFPQRIFAVKREAERFVVQVEAMIAAGENLNALTRSVVTVAEAVEAAMEADRHRLKPRTYESYRKIYDNRLLEKFGRHKITALRRDEIQRWVNYLRDEGLAPSTVRHHYVALRKACKWALAERLIAYDPCMSVSLPRDNSTVDSATEKILTFAQVELVAAQLESTPPYGLMVRFMAYTGLRAGEIAGLRIQDVDLAAGRVLVRQTAQRIQGQWVLGTPKSKCSTREVPLLNQQLISDLSMFKSALPQADVLHALFWPGRAPGSLEVDHTRVWDVATFRRNYFKPALIRAGLPKMRVHDLRHTAASLWLAAGFKTYEVSRWLGHASITTTDGIYAHLYPQDFSEHVAKFGAFTQGV